MRAAQVVQARIEWGEGKAERDEGEEGCVVYRMPESRRAFCRIVSLTAAKTRRICVGHGTRLEKEGKRGEMETHVGSICRLGEMRVDGESCPVELCEAPEDVLGSLVDVGSTWTRRS